MKTHECEWVVHLDAEWKNETEWDMENEYYLFEPKLYGCKTVHTFPRTNTNTKIHFGYIRIVASWRCEEREGSSYKWIK